MWSELSALFSSLESQRTLCLMLAPSNVSSLLFYLPRRVLFHMEKATSFLPLLSLIDSLYLVL